ncbi:MAG TPA: hypothetical protein VGF55_16465 [Gemmataceae bacterium]|jgi:hypothetical protein
MAAGRQSVKTRSPTGRAGVPTHNFHAGRSGEHARSRADDRPGPDPHAGADEHVRRHPHVLRIADSSPPTDSPAANRLGLNRALATNYESSAPEKFRPYRLRP